jgi:hypothetical protein
MKAEKCIASNTTLAKILKVEVHTIQSGLERLEERRYILRLYADAERKIRTEIRGLIHFKKVPTNEGTVPSNEGTVPNGIKLVVTRYHIKDYSSSCLVHPRAVGTGSCSIPRRHAAVHGSHQRLELMPRDPSHMDTPYVGT